VAEGVSDRPPPVRANDAAEPLSGVVGVSSGHYRRERQSSPHSRKFVLVTAALMIIALAAVAGAILILVAGGRAGAPAQWSAWSPSQDGIAGERQIADEVAPFYRATPATQLAVVTVQNVSGTGNEQVAVRDPNTGTLAGLTGTTAIYNVCGLGTNCAIAAGTPSSSRLLLLRREALELSLYTFKYISDISNVVAILPPGHTSTTNPQKITPNPPAPGTAASTTSPLNLAVVFQRASLKSFLGQPLRATLPEQVPPLPSQMDGAPEAELVSVVTSQALFKQQLVQAQDGTGVLVLDPLPPQ
jgi:hypothetical protein